MQKFNILCNFSFNLNLPTSIKRTLFRQHLHLDFFRLGLSLQNRIISKNSTDSTYEPFAPNFPKMLSPSKQRHDNKKTIGCPKCH